MMSMILESSWNTKADGMRIEDEIEVIPDDIDILLEDNCTKAEAKKYLETGTTIYRDLEEGLEGYCEEWDNCCADDGYSDMVREMVRTHKPCTDWGCVKIEGKWYYIMYVL